MDMFGSDRGHRLNAPEIYVSALPTFPRALADACSPFPRSGSLTLRHGDCVFLETDAGNQISDWKTRRQSFQSSAKTS